jgi:LuxR family maltose regulon positive regulatory protein
MQEIEIDPDKEGRRPFLPTPEGGGFRAEESVKRVIEALGLQAQALEIGGEHERALGTLGRALALARPEGYVRVWADMGPPLAALLYAALERGIEPEYVGRLLAAVPEAETTSPGTGPVPDQPELVEPLSARELEVLRLIAQGLSNRAIAERLVIALSTVKGHTSNIYGKLGVHNRTQAVARARTLGFLSIKSAALPLQAPISLFSRQDG